MGAVTTALIAIAAVGLGWLTIEMACKPCLQKGREAIDRNLNPDYDPDDQTDTTTLQAPLIPSIDESSADATVSATSPPSKTV